MGAKTAAREESGSPQAADEQVESESESRIGGKILVFESFGMKDG